MHITRSQVKMYRQAETAVRRRQPVVLTGSTNGKTHLIHKFLSVVAKEESDSTNTYVSRNKHAENLKVKYVTRVYLPTSNLTLPGLMKQVLDYLGETVPHGISGAVKKFNGLANQLADNGQILTLAIDNADLLTPKAWTVLKALNEYWDPVRDRAVGVGLLLAVDYDTMIRMPLAFFQRACEVQVQRIGSDEVGELIEALYPGSLKRVSKDALDRFSRAPNMGIMRTSIDMAMADVEDLGYDTLEVDVVEEKMSAVVALQARQENAKNKRARKQYRIAA